MSKKSIVYIVIATVVAIGIGLLILGLTGVFTREMRITDLQGFEKLNELPASINVVFSDEYEGEITVTESEQIGEICRLLSERYYRQTPIGATQPPGSNRYLKFVYEDGTTVDFNIDWITAKNGKIYSPTQRDSLSAYLTEIGLLLGGIREH